MYCGRSFLSASSPGRKPSEYPYDDETIYHGEEILAPCAHYHLAPDYPPDSCFSGYPVWLGLTESIPMFNHDSPSIYEETEFSTSPMSLEQDDISMTCEDEQPCEQSIQVATAFKPNHHDRETDLIVFSNDDVYFYAHSSFISEASPTALEGLLRYAMPSSPGTDKRVLPLPLSSPILNIILHALYKSSCEINAPSCDELIEAVDKLAALGLEISSFILPSTPLYTILISHAPRRPLDIYALAGHHDLYDLARYTSSHLLTFYLSRISDEMSVRIGPRYLKRMFLLQFSRTAALKNFMMSVPSEFHTPTSNCGGFEQQQKTLTRAWAMGTSTLAWELLTDSSVHHLQNVYSKPGRELQCPGCRDAFERHLTKAIFRWSEVKVTIS